MIRTETRIDDESFFFTVFDGRFVVETCDARVLLPTAREDLRKVLRGFRVFRKRDPFSVSTHPSVVGEAWAALEWAEANYSTTLDAMHRGVAKMEATMHHIDSAEDDE